MSRLTVLRTAFGALLVASAALTPRVAVAHCVAVAHAKPRLVLREFGTDSTSFHVVATAVIGKTEMILWDALMRPADAERMADTLAATGKKLKAILLSHPDHDHYGGIATLLQRFPGTPVYMTQPAIDWLNKTPNHGFTPQLLPATKLTVDGQTVEVIPDLQGDVITPTNSVLWIPSLRTALAGDILFNGIHAWLASSDSASRIRWQRALDRIEKLKPVAVVPGHKRDMTETDSPAVIKRMRQYLRDFDRFRSQSAGAAQLRDLIMAAYPDLAVRNLVGASAMAAFRPARPPGG
jgi:glyoxylase-like metal-dependent hydrolase (beta-lactamase superfamily II)